MPVILCDLNGALPLDEDGNVVIYMLDTPVTFKVMVDGKIYERSGTYNGEVAMYRQLPY